VAATLLQAVYDRYEAGKVANPSWPKAFSAIQPEGTAITWPNMLLEQPEDERYQLEQGDDDTLSIGYALGPVRFTAYAETLAGASALMVAVRDWMEATAITIGSDARVRLERFGYREAATGRKGQQGQFVFMARLTYRAMWNPVAD